MAERFVSAMLDDLRFHVDEVSVTTDPDHSRRSIDSALALVYRVQDALKTQLGDDYWQSVDGSEPGKITGAINLARHVNTHTLFIESAKSELFPSQNLFPGDDVVLGRALRWADYSDIEHVMRPPRGNAVDRRPYYRTYLSQGLVEPSLRTVIEFYKRLLTAR